MGERYLLRVACSTKRITHRDPLITFSVYLGDEGSHELHAHKHSHSSKMNDPDLRLVDDAMIIERTRTDPDAFEQIYLRYKGPIYRMCLRAVGETELAHDLTASIFLRAFDRLDHYQHRPGSTFRSWLFAIGRNIVLDHWRQGTPPIAWGDDMPLLIDDRPGPEEMVLTRIELNEVRDVLQTLNERHRSIVELRLSGLTTREIADVLGITISALKSAQTRAYATIRLRLTPNGGPQ